MKETFIDEYVSETIYNHGNEYYLAAQTLCGSGIPHTAPVATCYAFSIELFIKSLSATKKMTHIVSISYKLTDEILLKPKGPGAGHNLLALFECLHADTQKGIVEAYEVHRIRGGDFVSDLKRNSTVFSDWRYQYEGKTNVLETTTLSSIAAVLRKYVRTRLKEQYGLT